MKAVEQIKASEFMETDPLKAQNDSSLAQIKNMMEEDGKRAIPVVDSKDQLEGVVGYRDLIRFIQFNPENTKISKVMHQPPEFEEDDNLVDIADLRINSGRKMLVSLENEKLKGVISDPELLEALSRAEELKNMETEDVESKDLVTVFEQDSVEEARHLMLDNNISRLPVLDQDGKLTGIVRSVDILRTMIPTESPNPGGTSGNRHGTSEVSIAGGDEKDRMSEIPVNELMQRDVNTIDESLDGPEAVEKMKSSGNDELVLVDGQYPESLVTLKDLVDYVEGFAPGKTVLVNLVGLEVAEEKAAVHKQVKKQLQGSLGRKLRRPEEVRVHVKKSEKDGERHRYEIDLKLFSEYGQMNITEDGWELLDVVDRALNKLNEVVRREKEKMTEH